MNSSASWSLRRARSWGGTMTSGVGGFARCFCQYRQANQDKAAAPNPPNTHQSQNQPLGISTGALMSRMSSAASELVPALLVPEAGVGRIRALELVFIFIHDGGASPAFQKISLVRRR